MASTLFRSEVIEARRQRLAGTVVAAVPPSTRLYTIIAAVTSIIILLTLTFGQYASTANVRGIVAYDLGVARVSAASTGDVAVIHARAGMRVAAGAPLVTVVTALGANGLSTQLAEINTQVSEIDRQIVLAGTIGLTELQALQQQQAGLNTGIVSLRRQKSIVQSQIKITETMLARNARLAKAGAGSQRQVDDTRAALLSRQAESEALTQKISDAQSKIGEVGIQLGQRGLTSDTSRSQLVAQRAILLAQRADIARADRLVITAPVAGEVSDVVTEIGQRVGPDKSLVTIVPQGSVMETWLYAPTSAIGFASPGQKVRLRFDAYPYQKYGWGQGTVMAISRVAIDPANVDAAIRPTEPVFRVRVRIDSMGGLTVPKDGLRPGMTLSANLVMQSKPLWELIVGPVKARVGG